MHISLLSLIFALLLIYLGRDFVRHSSLKKRGSIVYLGVFWLSITFGIMLNLTLLILMPSRYSLSRAFDAAQFIVTSAGFSLVYWVAVAPFSHSVANVAQLESSLAKNALDLLEKAGLGKNRISLEKYGDLNIHNAYVTADLKPFKIIYRIRLSDGIASGKEYSPEEKIMILAHEIGHIKTLQRYILLTFIALFTLLITSRFILSYVVNLLFDSGFILLDIHLPMVLTLAIIFIAIYNALKRRAELQADKEALKYGGNKGALISALNKIYSRNQVSFKNPLINLIFQDHPELEKRIKNLA